MFYNLEANYVLFRQCKPEDLEQTFIDISNNTFPMETGIANLFHYIWGM